MLQARSESPVEFDNYLARGRFCRSWELYTDMDNRTLLVDRVLRYEQLNQDLGEVFDKLGVPWQGQLDVFAKAQYRSERKPYQQWYTEQQRDLVARAFADEIRQFSYAF